MKSRSQKIKIHINSLKRKMPPEELEQFLSFKRKGGKMKCKKGKGSYDRNKIKGEKNYED